jgi:hypothetical protein
MHGSTRSPPTGGNLKRLPRGVRCEAYCRLCPGCDYDLTGLPDECACPECGADIGHGLRSARVWWWEPPSTAEFAVMAILAVAFSVGFFAGIMAGGAYISLLIVGFFAFGSVFGTITSFCKLLTRAGGTTDATLHYSPRGVAIRWRERLWWYPWTDVQRIRLPITLRRHWTIAVQGTQRWYCLGRRRTLIKAAVRCNRREIALIRSGLRRCWRNAHAPETQ